MSPFETFFGIRENVLVVNAVREIRCNIQGILKTVFPWLRPQSSPYALSILHIAVHMDLKDRFFRGNVWTRNELPCDYGNAWIAKKTIFVNGLGTKNFFFMRRSHLQSAFSKRMITHTEWFSFDRMWKHLANRKYWIELLKASRLNLSKAWV